MNTPCTPNPEALALKHYHGNAKLQAKLIDAIDVVRSTTRGWLLDPAKRVQRLPPAAGKTIVDYMLGDRT